MVTWLGVVTGQDRITLLEMPHKSMHAVGGNRRRHQRPGCNGCRRHTCGSSVGTQHNLDTCRIGSVGVALAARDNVL